MGCLVCLVFLILLCICPPLAIIALVGVGLIMILMGIGEFCKGFKKGFDDARKR